MPDLRIAVDVDEDGQVSATRRDDDWMTQSYPLPCTPLDAELIRLFERWLQERDRVWGPDELRTFGALLHRALFPGAVWDWVEARLDEARLAGHRMRLELVFPSDGDRARLSLTPWEYLYRPATNGSEGYHLATSPHLVLSRYIPTSIGEDLAPPPSQPHIFVGVADPKDPNLARVVTEDVLESVGQAAERLGSTVRLETELTADKLAAAVQDGDAPPALVHVMAHGQFDGDRGTASLALLDPEGWADWVDDHRLAELLVSGRQPPRAVILHTCEGGKADYSRSFAGLAPQIVRRGVQCVVAMQYPVKNRVAIDFSRRLYEQFAAGVDLDVAVQTARRAIATSGANHDPRLIGLPMVYLQSPRALVAEPQPAPDADPAPRVKGS